MSGLFFKSIKKAPPPERTPFKIQARPPFHGLYAVSLQDALKRYRGLIEKVWLSLRGIDDTDRDKYSTPVIEGFIKYIGNLPASSKAEYHHACEWGLLEHTLKVAIFALNKLKADPHGPTGLYQEGNDPKITL